MNNLATKFATCFGVGYAPFAPGSFGSLLGLILGVALNMVFNHVSDELNVVLGIIAVVITISILTYISLVIIEKAEAQMNAHDPKSIVLDEVIGQAIVTSFFPPTLFYLLTSYALFRFFDILKPWPVGYIDRNWPHAKGTLFDDVAAGLMALGCLLLIDNYFI